MRHSSTHRRLTVLALIVLVVPVLVSLFPPASVQGQGGDVVISQVYAGGQSGTAPIRSDYIELFNPGTDLVLVDGWSLQYASRDGTTWRRLATTGPSPRALTQMAFDRRRGVMVLFGGRIRYPLDSDETWEWNGTTWRRVGGSASTGAP